MFTISPIRGNPIQATPRYLAKPGLVLLIVVNSVKTHGITELIHCMAFVIPVDYLYRMGKRCIHDFLIGECGFCKETPFGLNGVVYRTTHGKAFHNWDNCEYLESGQKFAESKGGSSTDIVSITWASANVNLYPCEWCCALFYSKGINLEDCLVTANGGQKPAKIVKDRYLGKNIREFQIYFPDTNEIEIMTNRYVTRYK